MDVRDFVDGFDVEVFDVIGDVPGRRAEVIERRVMNCDACIV